MLADDTSPIESPQQSECEQLAVALIHVAMNAVVSNCTQQLIAPQQGTHRPLLLFMDWMGDVSVKFKKTTALQRAYRLPLLCTAPALLRLPTHFIPAMFRLAHLVATNTSLNKPCGNCIRGLVETLSTQCSVLIFRDVPWLQSVLQEYLNSGNVQLRLLANRMICNLLVGSDGSGVVGSTLVTLNGVECPLVQHAICHQLSLTLDDDHVTRSKVILMLGSYHASYWRTVFNITSSTAEQNTMMPQFWAALLKLPNSPQEEIRQLIGRRAVGSTLSDAVLVYTMYCAMDKIGTVRTNAYKSLGDMISQCGLNRLSILPPQQVPSLELDDEILGGGLEVVDEDAELSHYECAICHHLMTLGRLGCLDSKLSVRIQAAWMVGNVVTAILPLRHAFTSGVMFPYKASSSSPRHRIHGHCSWLEDRVWLDLFRIQLNLLSDSEKIIPTAIHCLGILLGGMQPLLQAQFTLMAELHSIILQQYLKITPITAANIAAHLAIEGRTYDHLTQEIEHGSQKLLIGICQCLGFQVWITFETVQEVLSMEAKRHITMQLEPGAIENLKLMFMNCIHDVDVHLNFLRYGQLKLKLLSMKIVTYYLYTLAAVLTRVRLSVLLRGFLEESLLHSLFKRYCVYDSMRCVTCVEQLSSCCISAMSSTSARTTARRTPALRGGPLVAF